MDASDQSSSRTDSVFDPLVVKTDIPTPSSSQSDTEYSSQEDTLTMIDVLKSEEDLLDNVNAVLGGSDDKNCTYILGYLKRQALYACMTCIPDTKDEPSKWAGICLACCYYCHDGHELIELYTKRNFRCDCGNSKFPLNACNLDPNKSEVNELNTYNHNYAGIYCICLRPYPDPEETHNEDMIQCIICEDWFHYLHLGDNLNVNKPYEEMACKYCMEKHPFLYNYEIYSVSMVAEDVATQSGIAVVEAKALEVDDDIKNETTRKMNPIVRPSTCKMPIVGQLNKSTKFWVANWRKNLCRCQGCITLYYDENLTFLLDGEDTIHFYEEDGKAKAVENNVETSYDANMKKLNTLNRAPLMDTIAGYNDMKNSLWVYLKKFSENKKIVREEDIKEFFNEYEAKKKMKTGDYSQHYCR